MNTIESVREGMHVVDASGDRVGKVSAVSVGDPDAATTEGQNFGGSSVPLIDEFRSALGARDLPDEQAEKLMRLGYVHVHRTFREDLFATPEDLDRVEDDTLYLAVDAG